MLRGQAAVKLARRMGEGLPLYTDPACIQHPDLPWDGSAEDDDPRTRTAIGVCCQCPDLDACSRFAIARVDLTGIWGGLTTTQRSQLRTSRRP